MTKEKEKKVSKDQLLLEASRLGNYKQLETILSQMQQLKSRKKSNPLASLRKSVGPNSIRDPVTGFTCLHHASLNGHAECAQLLLDYGAKLNALDYKGSSALHLAAWAGNLEVVRIFLRQQQQGASYPSFSSSSSAPAGATSTTDTESSSPPGGASSGFNLQQNMQDSPNSPKQTLSTNQQSVSSSSKQQQQQLDINLCNNDNQTPLSLAAQFGHLQVVAELLSHGADPNIRNNQLESPLDLACLNGRQESVELLLESAPNLIYELRRPRATLSIIREQPGTGRVAGESFGFQQQQMATSQQREQQSLILANNNTNLGMAGSSERPVSVSGTDTLSPTGRRQSASAWSSLLRGRRDSSGQSPLYRLTAGTLSMRQKSPAKQITVDCTHEGASSPPAANDGAIRVVSGGGRSSRRATLTVGAPLIGGYQQQQQQQVVGKSNYTEQQQQQSSVLEERPLDHSPLHYATRRGHANVLNLLLTRYNANILQVTTQGGLLHEIALNNGKHSDMISLLFNHIMAIDMAQRVDLLNQFLNLKNAQQKNVFEVLDEINNRSAQEMKRLIYEFRDRIQQQQQQQQQQQRTLPMNFLTSSQIVGSSTSGRAAEQLANYQQQQLQQRSQLPNGGNLPAFTNSSQQPAIQSRQFSDIHQINSFLTMKRAPSHSQASTSVLRELNLPQDYPNQRFHSLTASGTTQTIDRRHGLRNFTAPFVQDQRVHSTAAFMDENIDQNHHLMTRSVSNLNQVPYAIQQQQKLHNSNYMWPLSQQQQQQQLQQPLTEMDLCLRKRRSKSRDLGTLLMEAKQVGGEPLYDNSFHHPHHQHHHLYPSSESDPEQQILPLSSWRNSNHQLVRSQTDCSHLMSKVFGSSLDNANNLQQVSAQTYSSLQQHQAGPPLNAIDRKTINRHYHVYDHEFYPPRLLAQQQQPAESVCQGKQSAVAVVPPLMMSREQQQLRASISSTRSLQSGGLNNCSQQNAPQYEQQQQQNKESKDRFLVRHSRTGVDADNFRSASVDQKRQDLIQLQRRLLAESASKQSQQQQQLEEQALTNSFSLESHLSEPHLFESTRKALMQDFDRMIGSELLNRSHREIIDGSLQHRNNPPPVPPPNTFAARKQSDGSTQSILAGVLLDMDSSGERLTVRGTRISFPTSKSIHNKSAQTSPNTSNSLTQTQKILYEKDVDDDDDDEINFPCEPPPKPPRLSLMNKSTSSQQFSSDPHSSSSSNYMQQQSAVSTSSKGSQCPLTEPPQIKPPPLPTQSDEKRAPLNQPLHLATPLNNTTSTKMVDPLNHLITTKYCQSSAGSSESQSEVGLLKLASLTSGGSSITSSSSSSSSSNSNPAPSMPGSKHKQQLASTGNHPIMRTITNTNDLDSGVCTSNSPASISHDSETSGTATDFRRNNRVPDYTSSSSSAIVKRNLMRPSSIQSKASSQNHNNLTSSSTTSGTNSSARDASHHPSSPPSPNTAQLCIEEVLTRSIEVNAQTVAATDQNISIDCTTNTRSSVDSWLTLEQAPSANDAAEADYENCRPLQIQLQLQHEAEMARLCSINLKAINENARRFSIDCRSVESDIIDNDHEEKNLDPALSYANQNITSLSQKSHSTLNRFEDEDDYAALSSSRNSSEVEGSCSNGSESSNGVATEKSEFAPHLCCKEVLLKVLVDENTLSNGDKKPSNGERSNNDYVHDIDEADSDDVFYINPSELKKIALKRSQADAETLTDEELCAAIDEDSGYIRFTLRKRRNNREVGNEDHKVTKGMNDIKEVVNVAEGLIHNKKTKLGSQENGVTLSCYSTSLQERKTILHPTDAKEQDQNNNDEGKIGEVKKACNSITNFNKKTAAELERWFSANLVALMEYLVKFLQNGLDNIQFFNHPSLINDEILKSIGIDEESHRQIIVQRVQSELPLLDLKQLISSHNLEQLNCSTLLDLLGISCLVFQDLDCTSSNWTLALREKSLELPIGYRVRLVEALNTMQELNQESTSLSSKAISRQSSSGSSGKEMEVEQGQQTPTNSSSSKDSIKSIVLKEPISFSQAALKADQASASVELPLEQVKLPVYEMANKQQVPQQIQINRTNSSLVSEVARKLEAAASQTNNQLAAAKSQLKPVAASRRINSQSQSLIVTQTNPTSNASSDVGKDPSSLNPLSKARIPKRGSVPVKSICWPPQSSDQTADSKQLASWNRVKPNKLQLDTLYTKHQAEENVLHQIANIENHPLVKVMEAEQQQVSNTRFRPKPAPPAKPAKLAAANKVICNERKL